MSGLVAIAVIGALAAALLALPHRPVRRRTTPDSRLDSPQGTGCVQGGHWLRRLRPLVAALGFLAGWAFLGGAVGLVAGTVVAAGMWRMVGGIEDPAVRRRAERVAADLPMAVDLMGACLAGGAAPETALRTVGEALAGPLADEFAVIQARLRLGVDPLTVWRALTVHPQLGPLGRTVSRAHESGAPISAAVHRLATELRESARAEVEARARTIEVKAAAPLGVCLLPAFVLLGVVPLVAGIFSTMTFLQ